MTCCRNERTSRTCVDSHAARSADSTQHLSLEYWYSPSATTCLGIACSPHHCFKNFCSPARTDPLRPHCKLGWGRRQINSMFAQRFEKFQNRWGHLFPVPNWNEVDTCREVCCLGCHIPCHQHTHNDCDSRPRKMRQTKLSACNAETNSSTMTVPAGSNSEPSNPRFTETT